MNGYVDASALVAALLREATSDAVEDVLLACTALASSRLTYVEIRSALASARRSGRLSRRAGTAARRELEQQWGEIDVVELIEPIAVSAGAATERHALASHDAIQLASALAVADGETVLVTLDDRLRRAAQRSGLGVAP